MRALLGKLGHPERALSAIHIAGTNGKGSTAAFTESILRAAGVRTGLYTSPHLHRFTERIRVGGDEIPAEEVAAVADRVLSAAPDATFFEVATAIALLWFVERGVEVAVVEAGLGGRWDATNALERPLATVVTGVALDHTEVLGPTLADIAREKAGIWKPGVPALFACDDEPASRVLREVAASVGAPAYRLGQEVEAEARDPLGLQGRFQRRNAALAVAAVRLAGIEVDDQARRRGLLEARWPGRFERLTEDVLVDAAHNPEGARALAGELASLAGGRSVTLLFGVVGDKDAGPMLEALRPVAARVLLTRAPTPRARDPQSLRALAPDAEIVPDVAQALARARTGPALVVAAGSIFLVAEVRRLVKGEPCDPISAQDPPAAQKL
jgi:dihydrofolate synthase/folylpolyglutamate synthase